MGYTSVGRFRTKVVLEDFAVAIWIGAIKKIVDGHGSSGNMTGLAVADRFRHPDSAASFQAINLRN